jgi:Spy/CpxP family protein refolding chaperone
MSAGASGKRSWSLRIPGRMRSGRTAGRAPSGRVTRRAWSGSFTRAVLLSVLTAAALTAPVAAQRGPDSRRGQNRAQLEQRFRAQMARMVQERLGLDDARAEALGDVMRSFEGRRRELGRAEFQARRQVEALVEQGSGDDDEARELLDRLVELRAQESVLFAEEQAALLEVITPTQVLQLHELRSELGRRIRALRSRGDGDGRGRRRGGSGGNVDVPRGVGLSL